MKMSDKYRPSNGTEGEMFMSQFCYNCVKYPINPNAKHQCKILCNMMVFNINEKEYPKQMIYDDSGKPTCTAYINRKAYNAKRIRKPKNNKNQPSLF